MQTRQSEFRVVNGKMVTVGIPTSIELAGLKAIHSIKPYTREEARKKLMSIANAARSSLKNI